MSSFFKIKLDIPLRLWSNVYVVGSPPINQLQGDKINFEIGHNVTAFRLTNPPEFDILYK